MAGEVVAAWSLPEDDCDCHDCVRLRDKAERAKAERAEPAWVYVLCRACGTIEMRPRGEVLCGACQHLHEVRVENERRWGRGRL